MRRLKTSTFPERGSPPGSVALPPLPSADAPVSAGRSTPPRTRRPTVPSSRRVVRRHCPDDPTAESTVAAIGPDAAGRAGVT